MITPETYTRHRATADRLIGRYGGAAVLVRIVRGTIDPDQPWIPVTDVEVLTPVSYIETGYQVGLHDGTLIQSGDVLGVMAVPATVTPTVAVDRLRVGGADYLLLDVKPIQPAPGAAVLQFAFQARR